MSTTNLKEFMAKVASDEKLRSAFSDRFEKGKEIPADDLIAFAGEQGYSFTVEEAEQELSEEALEGVAGGAGYLKIGDIKGESLDTTSTSNTFEEIKVTYSPLRTSFTVYGF